MKHRLLILIAISLGMMIGCEEGDEDHRVAEIAMRST